MNRAKTIVACTIAGGVIPLFLFFCAGCSDSSRTRASTGDAVANDPAPSNRTVNDRKSTKNTTQSTKNTTRVPSTSRNSSEVASEKDSQPTGGRRSGGIREITFDTIKFDIDKGEPFERSMLTKSIERLDGARVRIRGYMLPSFQQSGIKQFVLVRDNMECCFGPGAALYDCIVVEMQGDQTCDFSVRPIAVEGAFTVREFKGPDDTHLAIYHLEGERVR